MAETSKTALVRILGRVQGVSFRVWTRDDSQRLVDRLTPAEHPAEPLAERFHPARYRLPVDVRRECAHRHRMHGRGRQGWICEVGIILSRTRLPGAWLSTAMEAGHERDGVVGHAEEESIGRAAGQRLPEPAVSNGN